MRIEVLGPLRVVGPAGDDLTPDGTLQRRLLALLVARSGEAVSADAAIDVLWPADPPRDPAAALQNQIHRLRRRLGDGVIESTGAGYRLDASRVALDADRLTELVVAADGGPERRAELEATLARWQGPAYPELEDLDAGRIEAGRLAELRTRAVEALAAARLAAGEQDAALADLAILVDAEPLRERPVALLMTALADAGRRAEALRAYDNLRRRLAEELGIEPSAALAAQHRALLDGVGGAWTVATRLPTPATSLIGRDGLVDDVAAATAGSRVVTLVGPGGVGKTRLSIEVGHRLRGERPDRPVVVCELAAAGPESALHTVAAALRIDARPGTGWVERITGVVGDAEVVLVLDNCEHVLDPVAELVEHLVADCPGAVVVATSRERLRVAGEQVWVVPPLSLDDDDGPAVVLFVDRARAVAPHLRFDPHERATLAEIVRRLDGLPLAIELAAARLHTHDVEEVASGLDRRFSLLSAGRRTSTRHSSLHAAVSWSHGLLDEHLQRLFAHLSVFVGPFTVADAAAVCDQDERSVADGLAELTERSLVMRAPDHRYVLLETIQAFGAELLEASGRRDEITDRHAHRQVARAEECRRRLFDVGIGVVDEIEGALPELQAGLDHLLARGDLHGAGRLVFALRSYGIVRQRPDVLAWAERVLAADPDDRAPMAAQMWGMAAYAAWLEGRVDEVGPRAERAVRVAGADVPAEVATIRGNVELFAGRLDEAVEWYRRGAAAAGGEAERTFVRATELLARTYGNDPTAAALAEEVLAEVGPSTTPHAAYAWFCAGEADLTGDRDRARRRLTRALELADLTGASLVTGLAGASRASLDARHGDAHLAAADYRRLIVHWRTAGVWSTQWTMMRSIALLLARLGQWRDAAVLEGAVRATREGHRIFGADATALDDLSRRAEAALGSDAYRDAVREGAELDGDAAAEHALRVLAADRIGQADPPIAGRSG